MSEARYEYRVFAPDLSLVERRIRQQVSLSRYRESLETYLLIPGRHDVNLKIRDETLELKKLLTREQGLEQWHPEFKLTFPLRVGVLAEKLEGYLALEAEGPPVEDSDWDAARFVHWIADPYIGVAVASLFKQRYGFELAGCQVELVALSINGARLMSVALEAAEPAAVLALRETLGLAEEENVSYVLALERVLGRTPLPTDRFYNSRVR